MTNKKLSFFSIFNRQSPIANRQSFLCLCAYFSAWCVIFTLCTLHFALCTIPAFCQYNVYFGGLHSHTSYSDGKLDPAQAYDFAKNVGLVDFWAVTDHFEQLPETDPGNKLDPTKRNIEWPDTLQTAKQKTEDGKFIAIAAYEWADNTQGHINVFNTEIVPRFEVTFSLKQFYNWLKKRPEAIGGFNHPSGQAEERKKFNDFEFIKELDNKLVYIEVNSAADISYYFQALDKGWHLGALAVQDNHEADWGTKNENRGAILAENLSYSAIIDALKNKRFYATIDKNTKFYFSVNDSIMGSTIEVDTASAADSAKINFFILVETPDVEDEIENVKILTTGGTIAKEFLSSEATLLENLEKDYQHQLSETINFATPKSKIFLSQIPLNNFLKESTKTEIFFVAQINYKNGKFAISSPVWIRYSDALRFLR